MRNIVVILGILIILAVGCTVDSEEPSVVEPGAETISTPAIESTPPGSDCPSNGSVHTTEDLHCYLQLFSPEFVSYYSDDIAVLYFDPSGTADTVGAAIAYHIPTVSSLAFDRFGDVDPTFSHINNRFGLAAFEGLLGDLEQIASIQTKIQSTWQTAPTNQPDLRLSLAWQDGPTAVFLVAIAGLPVEDDRFYCPGELWRLGDEMLAVAKDCVILQPGTLVQRSFFISQQIANSDEIPVQLTINDVVSNEVTVAPASATDEGEIYELIFQDMGINSAIVQMETIPLSASALELLSEGPVAETDSPLSNQFVSENETSHSLRYLFQYSDHYFLQQEQTLAEYYYFNPDNSTDCQRFTDEYNGLDGIVQVNQLVINESSDRAIVGIELYCNNDSSEGWLFALAKSDGHWQIDSSRPFSIATTGFSLPSLKYVDQARGCGSLFIYQGNAANSEFIRLSADAFQLGLGPEPKLIDLSQTNTEIVVEIDQFADRVGNLGEFPYCNDVGPEAKPHTIWQAVSGQATFTLTDHPPQQQCGDQADYKATVLLENVTFIHGEQSVHLDQLLLADVTVGWCAG